MKRRPTFENIILDLKRYWQNKGCLIFEPYNSEVGPVHLIPRHSCGSLIKNPGTSATWNRQNGRAMDGTQKIPTGYSSFTNSR